MSTKVLISGNNVCTILGRSQEGKSVQVVVLDEPQPLPTLQPFEEVVRVGVEQQRTDVELKKLIKHCKNPMEKITLQRELSTINFYNGKHRNTKRRKHK